MAIFTQDALKGILGDASDTANTLAAPLVKLYTNDIVVGPTTPLASLTEAAWPGYLGTTAVTFTAPYTVPGGAEMSGQAVSFTFTGDPEDAGEAKGYYLVSPGGSPKLLQVTPFAEPLSFTAESDTHIIVPTVRLLSETE